MCWSLPTKARWVILAAYFRFGSSAFTHPHVVPLLANGDGMLPFEICLEVQLNGFDMTAAVGGSHSSSSSTFDGQFNKLNATSTAHALLAMADARSLGNGANTALAEDTTALLSMTGWVENRVTSKVSGKLSQGNECQAKLLRSTALSHQQRLEGRLEGAAFRFAPFA